MSMTPEDASRRERLAQMVELEVVRCEREARQRRQAASSSRNANDPDAQAYHTDGAVEAQAEAADWREIASILRAASPAAPGERRLEGWAHWTENRGPGEVSGWLCTVEDGTNTVSAGPQWKHRRCTLIIQPEPHAEEGER